MKKPVLFLRKRARKLLPSGAVHIETGKQTTWVWATPLVGMVLFIAAMGAFLYALHVQDENQVNDTVIRDVELARNTLRTRLQTTQDRISNLARDLSSNEEGAVPFTLRAKEILGDTPELSSMGVMDSEKMSRSVVASPFQYSSVLHPNNERIDDAESYWAFEAARELLRPSYSRPFLASGSDVYVEIHAPIINKGVFQGTVYGVFPVNNLLNMSLPEDFRRRYLVTIIDGGGNPIASNSSRSIDRARLSHEVPLDPPGQGLRLRAVLYKSASELASNMLAWTVVGLSLILLWSFALLFRHAKLRTAAEQRLLAETKFRRAMENSVMTGMRSLDMEGRITYVNPAFCKMTGFTEHELVGKGPPYPYWPRDSLDEQQQNLKMLLSGLAPVGGLESRIRRKDGSEFFARMYVSPLLDSHGVQSGWMTSITDITEPKRVREELAAAHGRFTKVLEELAAAVSVTVLNDHGRREYLFTNKVYRDWFGQDRSHPDMHQVRMRQMSSDTLEWQQPGTGKWFELRQRFIPWVDGRLVSMMVATDITPRKEAEETAREQQEKLQFTSRLVTMGELASSLAHELNQPLAAIANYSMGSVARIKSGKATLEDVLPAMEKATVQAQRAGNVIRRIREFVKRKAPNRKQCAMRQVVEDAVGFAELEAKNKSAQIHTDIQDDMQDAFADPILIEQVLLNLIKNAIDAMKDVPPHRKIVTVEVRQIDDQIEVSVADQGCGVPEPIRDKLFESFFSTKEDGMGMGLNICRTIIEYHEGRLWVDPNEEQGSVFRFRLPLAKEINASTQPESMDI